MAARKKKNNKSVGRSSNKEVTTEPKFPYCVVPKSLRRFLEMVPDKPRPPKVTSSTLKTWGLKSGNDVGILRVLKSIGLLSGGGETTQEYADFMKKGTGPDVLGRLIQRAYSSLFENVKNPENASNDELISFFNINSGGSESTIRYQSETFKALADFATFGTSDPLRQTNDDETNSCAEYRGEKNRDPIIRIDLHIHLPENKSKSDYDALLESIATHLYRTSR